MYTQPNRPLQNERKWLAIADRMCSVAEALSAHVSNDLMEVSVPAEDG
jgi:hypothetical protein